MILQISVDFHYPSSTLVIFHLMIIFVNFCGPFGGLSAHQTVGKLTVQLWGQCFVLELKDQSYTLKMSVAYGAIESRPEIHWETYIYIYIIMYIIYNIYIYISCSVPRNMNRLFFQCFSAGETLGVRAIWPSFVPKQGGSTADSPA